MLDYNASWTLFSHSISNYPADFQDFFDKFSICGFICVRKRGMEFILFCNATHESTWENKRCRGRATVNSHSVIVELDSAAGRVRGLLSVPNANCSQTNCRQGCTRTARTRALEHLLCYIRLDGIIMHVNVETTTSNSRPVRPDTRKYAIYRRSKYHRSANALELWLIPSCRLYMCWCSISLVSEYLCVLYICIN